LRSTAKYIRQDYTSITNAEILSELKIKPVLKKIQSYRNKLVQHVRQLDGDRLPHLTVKHLPSGKDDSSKDFWTVNGTGTGHEA